MQEKEWEQQKGNDKVKDLSLSQVLREPSFANFWCSCRNLSPPFLKHRNPISYFTILLD
jgi:hypothetical protein